MCMCSPNVRTPFCGKGFCKPGYYHPEGRLDQPPAIKHEIPNQDLQVMTPGGVIAIPADPPLEPGYAHVPGHGYIPLPPACAYCGGLS